MSCTCKHERLTHDCGTNVCMAQGCLCMKYLEEGLLSKRACPKGHETGVRELGVGKYFCFRCGAKWTA